MTTFAPDVTPSYMGDQRPRIELVPDGDEHPDTVAALELVDAAGIRLDPWQKHVLRTSLRRRDDRWAAFSVGVCASRQNGKNGITEARELVGPLVLGERLIIHTAHLADTSKEAFRRLDEILEANEWLSKEVRHVWRTNGHEAIEFMDGRRIRFRTRTKGGGRGFSGDLVIFDEAMILPQASVGSILPLLSAQPDPQVWYAGSVVDQMIHEHGHQWARVRERALAGEDPSLAYFEWSIDADTPDDVTDEMAGDPRLWAQANPALGIRISEQYIENERRELDARTFAVERLGAGDWPVSGVAGDAVVDLLKWDLSEDAKSTLLDPIVLAFDVNPARSRASIVAVGRRKDGKAHAEVVPHSTADPEETLQGTGWLVARMVELAGKHRPQWVVCDAKGPGASLVRELEAKGVTVTVLDPTEYVQACGHLVDTVDQGTLRFLPSPELHAAVRGAKKRSLGDAFAWARKPSAADITSFVALTVGLWKARDIQPPRYRSRGFR